MNKSNPFKSIINGKTVFLGIGNILRGDDGFGPILVEKLKGRINAVCINAENTPENYIGKIVKENPDTIIIIDAVHINLEPGQFEIINPLHLLNTGFSTHDISLVKLIKYLKLEINSKIYLLGIQPGSLRLGDGLSENVKNALRLLESMIIEAFALFNP